MTQPLIQLRNISKAYDEGGRRRVIFDDVNLDIATGEFVVLLGKSGCGKSTLLNLLGGIDDPTSGDVIVNGRVINTLNDTARTLYRRDNVGFVFQAFNLIPTLSALENVALTLELQRSSPREAAARAHTMLQTVGLAARANAFPDRMSGGEQQRVAIARALVADPKIVLADEPTGNLDADTGKAVLELLDSLTRRAGKNLVMVTHSQDMVGIADRVLNMREGKLMEVKNSTAFAE